MKHKNRVSVVFAVMLSFSILSFSCNDKQSDEEVQQSVNEKLQSGNFGNVTASVADGTVTLDGNCEGENCKSSAEEAAREVKGVKEVVNNIGQTTDLTLRTSVQQIISKYQGVQADVANGVVVLRGTIDKNQVQALTNELKALPLKGLDNQLAVQ